MDSLEKLGRGRRGIAGPEHERNGAVLNLDHSFFEPVRTFGMTLPARAQIVFERAHDAVIGDFVHSYPGVRHMTVGTRSPRFPMHAVVREKLEFRMPDEGQLETGNRLFPLFEGIVAADHLDDVFNGDVAKLAFLPGKEKTNGVHVLVFGNIVGNMALGANSGAHFLAREIVRIDPDRLEEPPQG